VVTVEGPDEATSSETVALSADIALSARKQAEASWGSKALDVDVRVSRAPWLDVGDLVRLTGRAVDPGQGSDPFAQIVGFLPVGGVLAVQAGAGAGVFAPEDLLPVSANDIDPATLVEIRERAGPPPPDAL
jgi:hypothetical protein